MNEGANWDRIAAAVLRAMPLEAGEAWFASDAWRSLSPEEQERLYVAEAELDAIDRRRYLQARQEQADAAYQQRIGP